MKILLYFISWVEKFDWVIEHQTKIEKMLKGKQTVIYITKSLSMTWGFVKKTLIVYEYKSSGQGYYKLISF